MVIKHNHQVHSANLILLVPTSPSYFVGTCGEGWAGNGQGSCLQRAALKAHTVWCRTRACEEERSANSIPLSSSSSCGFKFSVAIAAPPRLSLHALRGRQCTVVDAIRAVCGCATFASAILGIVVHFLSVFAVHRRGLY